jgi:hypothetical protein
MIKENIFIAAFDQITVQFGNRSNEKLFAIYFEPIKIKIIKHVSIVNAIFTIRNILITSLLFQIFDAFKDARPSSRIGEDRREAEGSANDCVSGLQDHGPPNNQDLAHKSQSGHQEFIIKHFPCILIRDCPCYTELGLSCYI